MTAPNTAAYLDGRHAANRHLGQVATRTSRPSARQNVKISLSTDGGQTFPYRVGGFDREQRQRERSPSRTEFKPRRRASKSKPSATSFSIFRTRILRLTTVTFARRLSRHRPDAGSVGTVGDNHRHEFHGRNRRSNSAAMSRRRRSMSSTDTTTRSDSSRQSDQRRNHFQQTRLRRQTNSRFSAFAPVRRKI